MIFFLNFLLRAVVQVLYRQDWVNTKLRKNLIILQKISWGKTDIDDFLSSFMEKRTVCNILRLRTSDSEYQITYVYSWEKKILAHYWAEVLSAMRGNWRALRMIAACYYHFKPACWEHTQKSHNSSVSEMIAEVFSSLNSQILFLKSLMKLFGWEYNLGGKKCKLIYFHLLWTLENFFP